MNSNNGLNDLLHEVEARPQLWYGKEENFLTDFLGLLDQTYHSFCWSLFNKYFYTFTYLQYKHKYTKICRNTFYQRVIHKRTNSSILQNTLLHWWMDLIKYYGAVRTGSSIRKNTFMFSIVEWHQHKLKVSSMIISQKYISRFQIHFQYLFSSQVQTQIMSVWRFALFRTHKQFVGCLISQVGLLKWNI